MYKKELKENEKPLYRYKLTEDMRLVKSQPIYRYTLEKWGYHSKYVFKLDGQSAYAYVKDKDLDKISHNRYYTFNSNDKEIQKVFLDSLISKVVKAQEELDKQTKLLEAFKSNNN